MSKPKVSIIVPVYNVEKYLEQCLDSLVNQSLKEIEIICIDDESSDNSLDILYRYSENDSRIKVISQKNTGLSGARNTGINHVNGDYLMFVDSDDWLDLHTCERVYKEAVLNECDVVMWPYVREYENMSKPKILFKDEKIIFNESETKSKLHRRFVGLLGEELRYPEHGDTIVTACMKLIKTSLIVDNKIKFIDTNKIGTEDAFFNLILFGYVKKTVYINEMMYHYRRSNEESLTTVYNDRLYEKWQNLYSYMGKYIEDNSLDYSYNIALNNRIALSLIRLGLNELVSEKNIFNKIKEIKRIISTPRYITAYRNLDIKQLPFHWKIFFYCARFKLSVIIFILLYIIKKAINK